MRLVNRTWISVLTVVKPLVKYSPGSGMVFVPSLNCLRQLSSKFEKEDIQEILETDEPIYIDHPDYPNDRKSYLEHSQQGMKSVLLTYCRGNMSEGIDIPDISFVAIVGVPLPSFLNASCFFTQWVHKRELKHAEDPLVINAMLSVGQALGRCLRTYDSKGLLVLIDSRYVDDPNSSVYTDRLPAWINKRRVTFQRYSSFETAVRAKFSELVSFSQSCASSSDESLGDYCSEDSCSDAFLSSSSRSPYRHADQGYDVGSFKYRLQNIDAWDFSVDKLGVKDMKVEGNYI